MKLHITSALSYVPKILFAFVVAAVFLGGSTLLSGTTYAQTDPQFDNGVYEKKDPGPTCNGTDSSGNVDPAAIEGCLQQNRIVMIIKDIVAFLSAGVGIVVVIMIIVGGIQYASAGGDPNKVVEAKKKIYNAVLALVVYAFMFTLLQWLVPGGIISV